MAQDLIVRVRGRAVAPRDLITRIRGRAAASITVTVGSGRNVEPYESVSLQAAASRVPDSWAWEQLDGYPVQLAGSGSARTFVAPATLNGSDLTFRVTATIVGGTPALATIVHHVYPHTMWRKVGNDIAPVVLTV